MWLPSETLDISSLYVPFQIVVTIPFPIELFRFKAQRLFLEDGKSGQTWTFNEDNGSRCCKTSAHLGDPFIPDSENHVS